MAELSEVLALRMENHDQQQREVSQLRTQVMKLQQRCQLVRQVVCGAPSSCHGLWDSSPLLLPHLMELPAQPGPRPLPVSVRAGGDLREPLILSPSLPQVRDRGPERVTGSSRN